MKKKKIVTGLIIGTVVGVVFIVAFSMGVVMGESNTIVANKINTETYCEMRMFEAGYVYKYTNDLWVVNYVEYRVQGDKNNIMTIELEKMHNY